MQAACGEGSIDKGPLKAYLYWVTREQSSFNWFMDVMNGIAEINQKQVNPNRTLIDSYAIFKIFSLIIVTSCGLFLQSVVEVFNFLTSVYQEGDARSALISIIQSLYLAKTGIDVVSGTPVSMYEAN